MIMFLIIITFMFDEVVEKLYENLVGLWTLMTALVYSGTQLIWTPRGHAKVSVLTGVCIKRVNLRENV